jgi:enhancer of mRNA-decapping protein 4
VARSAREAASETIIKTLKDMPIVSHPSRSVTPQPPCTDPQTRLATILGLVAQGQLNSAFQMALSASDLSVVMSLCERINPQQVFNLSPCPLQQPVLLSLIQQLSADLNGQTELKHK